MQQLSTRERTLIRLGVVVAILVTLWVFGLIRGPAVAY